MTFGGQCSDPLSDHPWKPNCYEPESNQSRAAKSPAADWSLLNVTQKDAGADSVLGTPPVVSIEILGQMWVPSATLPEVLESPSHPIPWVGESS